MVNVSQFSPRVTRSKSKKQQKVDAAEDDSRQKKTDETQKKNGRGKGKKKSAKSSGEVNSVRATRGSVGTISLLQTPKTCEGTQKKTKSCGLLSPRRNLQPPENLLQLKSPPIGTISADTPERSSQFLMQIENIAQCRLRILAKGSFGTVIQATYKGELVAAKIVPANRSDSLKNELNNFLLSHPNIVKTLRIISNEDSNSCGLVIMEMYSSYTLENLVNDDSYNLNEKSIVSYMTDIARALDYCHNQRVLHLDVKPRNILVNVATQMCKLCDFGSSCLLTGENMTTEGPDFKAMQSTVVYTSPELLTGGSPTEKSDIYSFGISLWQLLHREKPYVVDNKIDLQSTIYKIVKQKERPQKKSKKPNKLEKLYTNCWEHEPEKRPTMKEVIEYLESVTVS